MRSVSEAESGSAKDLATAEGRWALGRAEIKCKGRGEGEKAAIMRKTVMC